jgi:hypothetical protein
MGVSVAHGGQLTHGSPVNLSSKWFSVVSYGLDENEDIDNGAAVVRYLVLAYSKYAYDDDAICRSRPRLCAT